MPRSTADPADITSPQGAAAPVRRRPTGPALNRVELIGRLTVDAPLRFTSSGIGVASLRVAVNDGAQAEFVDVVCWRQLAEFAGRYLTKGRLIYVSGRLHGRTWQAEDGTTRRSAEVVAEDVQALDRRPAGTEEPMPQSDQA